MSRYKPIGWRNDNYRHSLAARGISTRNALATKYIAFTHQQSSAKWSPTNIAYVVPVEEANADESMEKEFEYLGEVYPGERIAAYEGETEPEVTNTIRDLNLDLAGKKELHYAAAGQDVNGKLLPEVARRTVQREALIKLYGPGMVERWDKLKEQRLSNIAQKRQEESDASMKKYYESKRK